LVAQILVDADGRRALAVGAVEDALGLGLATSAPYLLKRAVDQLGHASALQLSGLVSGFVLCWTAPSVVSALKAPKTAHLVDRLYRRMGQTLLYRQLPRLATGEEPESGRLASALERLPFSLSTIIDGLIWRTLPILGQLLVSLLALALTLPPRYAALLGLTVIAYAAVSYRGAGRHAAQIQAFNASTSRLSIDLADVLRNAERILCNGTLASEIAGLQMAAGERVRAQAALARSVLLSASLQFITLAVGLSLVLILAGLDVSAGRLRIGDFVLLQAFALRLALPIGGLVLVVRQAAVALANVDEVLSLGEDDRLDRIGGLHEPAALDAMSAALAVDNVSFAFPTGAGVTDVSVTLRSPQLVALVGPNGSGKSTLARLITGILKPTKGAIHVGGVPLSTIAADRRAGTVLYVPQFISLFNRSIGANGRYPPAELTSDALEARLQAWRFNETKPVDLSVLAGEQGAQLSGGQVQKLELARLCAVETSILVLDESTSALDQRSEAEAIAALRARRAGRLTILVTHREAIAAGADQVIFMQAGRIAAMGTHSALMRLASYRNLWGQQE
jgi:ABC-type multidrug transport system fused ATPase/permease subunit